MRSTPDDAFLDGLSKDSEFLRRGLVCGSGQEFLEWFAEALARELGSAYVLIGELAGEDSEQVRTLVVRTPAGLAENMTYDLVGTPCANVVGQQVCAYPRDVDLIFPDDLLLVDMGVKSYVGMPLTEPGGRPLGLVVVLHTDHIDEEQVVAATAAMNRFRGRSENELAKRRANAELQTVLDAASQPSTERALQNLVSGLALSLGVDTVWVARPSRGNLLSRSVVALFTREGTNELFEYPIAGSPGDGLQLGGLSIVPADAQHVMPTSKPLVEFGAAAVCCRSLLDRQGELLGELVFVHSRPISENLAHQPILDVFGALIAAELERGDAQDEQVRMEQQLQAVQQMEALGGLAGGIAHDFNNLLAAILGNAELAQDDCESNSATAESLNQIERAALRAAELCRQLLDYAGRQNLTLERLEWNALIADMAELLTASLPKKVRLEFELQEPSPIVEVDPGPLRQVILNLITNAADAIGDSDGCIRMRTARVEIGLGLDRAAAREPLCVGSYALLEVRDDGCGMEAATKRRIFDPYFTTKSTGHGLGLAAVQGILRQHGGTIEVESMRGVGTTFRVYVPLDGDDALEPEREPGDSSERSAGSRVLLADDEDLVREVTGRVLERSGFHVTSARDGEDALRIFRKDPGGFDVLLLDLSMPGLDGIETLRSARELRTDIPVVLVSGYLSEEIAKRLEDGEVQATVGKPFTRDALIRAVNSALTVLPNQLD